MHVSELGRWKREEIWLAEVEFDLYYQPAVFGQVLVSCSEQVLRDVRGPDPASSSFLCFFSAPAVLKIIIVIRNTQRRICPEKTSENDVCLSCQKA